MWRTIRRFLLAGLALDLACGALALAAWLLVGCAAPSSVRPHNHSHSHGCGFHTHAHGYGHHATYGVGGGGCERESYLRNRRDGRRRLPYQDDDE